MTVLHQCQRCGATPGPAAGSVICLACERTIDAFGVPKHEADFWQATVLREAFATQQFGCVVRAYRLAHTPALSQVTISHWLEMTQANVSRMELHVTSSQDLRKLRAWASTLRIPLDLWWFAPPYKSDFSASAPVQANLGNVHRRDMLKLAGAALVTSSGLVSDPPWTRLSDAMAGARRTDMTTVAMAEQQTRAFFHSEETQPARALVADLRAHRQGLSRMIATADGAANQQRLISAEGETAALEGWTLFDLGRRTEAETVYQDALATAREAGDQPLVACVYGYWSYLLSSSGDQHGAVRMLETASHHVRGSDAATQAWILARLAEEAAAIGEAATALRSLDQAVAVFDYASADGTRPWTSFFTANRLGSLAVSTYGRLAHRDTDQLAASLLESLSSTENKVRALVLADLATSAAHGGDYDRVDSLTAQSAPLATKWEASLAVDRLWDVVEFLPSGSGTAGRVRRQLTDRLLAGTAS